MMKKVLLAVLLLVLIIPIGESQVASCTSITRAYISLDDEGILPYSPTTGNVIGTNVHVFLIAEGNCQDGAVATFNLYDTDRATPQLPAPGATPLETVQVGDEARFYRGKAIAKWTTVKRTESASEDIDIPQSSEVDYIFRVWNGLQERVSENYVTVKSTASGGNYCKDSQKGAAGIFEACESSIQPSDPFFAGKFYDNSNSVPVNFQDPKGFDFGARFCTDSGTVGCGISYSHACKLESATVSAVTADGSTNLRPGDKLLITAANLRVTKPGQIYTNRVDCNFDGDLIFVASDQSCSFVFGDYTPSSTNIIGVERGQVTPLSPPTSTDRNNPVYTNTLINYYYDIYPTISGQWTVPTNLPSSCFGRTITSGTVYVTTKTPTGQYNWIAQAPVSTFFSFLSGSTVNCTDGTSVGFCSTQNPGSLCKDVGGVPKLVPNCNGQNGQPSCGCGGGTCRQGSFTTYSQNFDGAFSLNDNDVQDVSGSLSIFDFDTVNFVSSPKSFKLIKSNAAGYSLLNISLPTEGGKIYTVQAKVKTNRQNFARVYVKTGNVIEIGAVKSLFHTGSGQWEDLFLTFTGSSTPQYLALQVTGTEGTAYFDDITISISDEYVCQTPGSTCSLNSVTVSTPACPGGLCGPGDPISISGSYSGTTCPAQFRIQVDARSADGLCEIQQANTNGIPGFIAGMSINCVSGSGTCSGNWNLPSTIPQECLGRVLNQVSASLRRTDNTYLGDAGSTSGSISFVSQSDISNLNVNPTTVALGTPVTVTATTGGTTPLILQCGDSPTLSNLCTSSPAINPSCVFNAPWTGTSTKTIYCRTCSGSICSGERTATINVDNTGLNIDFVSPAPGSWQGQDFFATINWGASPTTCRYAVNSSSLPTVQPTTVPCNPDIRITVGPNSNCRNEGTNTCIVTVSSVNNIGVTSTVTRRFSVSFGAPGVSVDHSPAIVGAETFVTFTASASSNPSKIKKMHIYINNILESEQIFNPPVSIAQLTATKKFSAGTSVTYRALAENEAGVNITTTNKQFTVCKLNSISVSCPGGTCEQGEVASVTADYSGTCPSASYIDIGGASGGCSMQAVAGSMPSIQFACTSSPCSSVWTVPSVPASCRGANVTLNAASLWNNGYPPQNLVNRFDLISSSSIIRFGYPVGFCPADNFYMLVNNQCVPARCGSTDYLACQKNTQNQDTGFYCSGTPRGNGTNVIDNIGLIPGSQFGCMCPPDQQFLSRPYFGTYGNSFETSQQIDFQNTGGSTGSGGIFSGGASGSGINGGSYSYLIDKTNAAGASIAKLPAGVTQGEEYTVSAYVKTNETNAAFIRSLDGSFASKAHTGSNSWEKLSYVFSASSSQHTVVLEIKNKAAQARFDLVNVSRHDLICTQTCIDGTPVNECSESPEYPSSLCTPGNPIPQPNLARCGPPTCAPDGTPYGSCSRNLTGSDILGGGRGIVFCSNGNWIEDAARCGCGTGFGYDAESNSCVSCQNVQPPIGGYAKCEQTGGRLNTSVIVNNATCSASYTCSCPAGKLFDQGFGCVSNCNNDNICQSYETVSSCPSDCPIQFTAINKNLTENGIVFSGEIAISLMSNFRACDANSTLEQCISVPSTSCNKNSPCLCSSIFSKSCGLQCTDKSGLFYLYAEGTYIEGINSRQVKIASPVNAYSCPTLNIPQLEQHLQNFIRITDDAFTGLQIAVINEAAATDDEQRAYWRQQINIFQEIVVISQAHEVYLRSVIENPTLQKVTEAFALTTQRYDEIRRILSGLFTSFTLGDISFPDVVEVPLGRNGTVEISAVATSSGNSTRWIQVGCDLRGPNNTIRSPVSNCTQLNVNSDTSVNIYGSVNVYGVWNIPSCNLYVSASPVCEAPLVFQTLRDVGSFNVTRFYYINIEDVDVPSDLGLGDLAVFNTEIKNTDQSAHSVYVSCSVRSPSRSYDMTTENRSVGSGQTVIFTPNRTVDVQGEWTLVKCTAYRTGVREEELILNEPFQVGPADFVLDPSFASGSAAPGGIIEYNLTLKNKGLSRETYILNISVNNNWTARLLIGGVVKNSQVLDAKQSSNITVELNSGSSGKGSNATVTVTSGVGRIRESRFSTILSVPNRPPLVRIIDIPAKIRQNTTITFAADIVDQENDTFSARVCIGNCTLTCSLSRQGSVYKCEYSASLSLGSYSYFVNATDNKDIRVSDAEAFEIISADYCDLETTCPAGKECLDNRCVRPVSCPGTINQCYPIVSSNTCGSCSSGFACENNICVPVEGQCSQDTDCGDFEQCSGFQCVSFAGESCRVDEECGPGFECMSGSCKEIPKGDSTFIIFIIIIIVVGSAALFWFLRHRKVETEDFI